MKSKGNLGKFAKLGASMTALAALVLAGCGGSGLAGLGGGGASLAFNVVPVLGQFDVNATIRVRDRNNNLLQSTKVQTSGVAPVSIPANAAFPLIIEAGLVGERYYDENTGAMTLITTSGVTASGAAIRALIADVTNLNATSSVGVTPFTEMAVTSLQNISGVLPTGTALTAVSAVAANNAIGNAFAMSNVLLAPTLVNTSAVLTALPANEAGQYAAKLAGLARMANTPVKGGTAPTTGEDALRAANRLRDDLINGRITPNQLATQLNAAMTANVSGVAIANATAAQLPVPAAAMTWTHVQDVANFAVGEMNKALNGKATQAQIIAAIQNAANQAWAGLQTALNGAGANPNLANLLAQVKGNTTTGINTAAAAFSPTISLVSVSGVNANSGVAAATGAVGDTVSIMGTGFDAFSQHNIVKFSGTQATHTAASGTSGVLVVTVPAGAVTGPLTVTNFMTNATTPAFSFTVPGTAIANCPAGQTLNPLMQCVAAGTGGTTTGGTAGTWNLAITGSVSAAGFSTPVNVPVTNLPAAPDVTAVNQAVTAAYGTFGNIVITPSTNTATAKSFTVTFSGVINGMSMSYNLTYAYTKV